MKLLEILQEVKDASLTKSALESYHTTLSGLYGDLMMEIAALTKERALFEARDPELSVAKAKVLWKATKEGQRLIELLGYARATNTQLRSIKNRLYAIY